MNGRIISFLTILFLSALGAHGAIPPEMSEAYSQGNHSYADGEFTVAIAAYEEALEYGESANLHFNTANAHAELEAWGQAVLHYHKALALEPHHADARTNLYIALQRAQLDATDPGVWREWAENLPLTVWIVAASAAFWILVGIWLLWNRHRFPAPRLRVLLTLVCVSVLLAAAPALYGYHLAGRTGVVVANDVTLRVAPTPHSPGTADLAPGDTAHIRRTVKGYYLVELPSGQDGYLAPDEFEPVWDSAPRPEPNLQ